MGVVLYLAKQQGGGGGDFLETLAPAPYSRLRQHSSAAQNREGCASSFSRLCFNDHLFWVAAISFGSDKLWQWLNRTRSQAPQGSKVMNSNKVAAAIVLHGSHKNFSNRGLCFLPSPPVISWQNSSCDWSLRRQVWEALCRGHFKLHARGLGLVQYGRCCPEKSQENLTPNLQNRDVILFFVAGGFGNRFGRRLGFDGGKGIPGTERGLGRTPAVETLLHQSSTSTDRLLLFSRQWRQLHSSLYSGSGTTRQ